MTKKNNVTIEGYKPFSESLFWNAQRDFYHQKGITAWTGEVPFYITSNPFIANSYAEIIIRFIQDCLHKDPSSINHPFYVMELGAGSGQFSFYTIKTLMTLLEKFALTTVTVRYLMTDFTENNLKFWQQHDKLLPFVKQGVLDFALFDLEQSDALTSVNHHYQLKKNTLKNPLIVIANYLLDSIKNDIFAVKNNKLQQSLVTLTTPSSNISNELPKSWQKVKIEHQEENIGEHHYQDEHLDSTLIHYKKALNDAYLLFPIAALKGFNRLKDFAHGKLLLISSDKGYSTPHELEEAGYPELDFHGSFSLMVNYHAIAHYFKQLQGDAFIATPRDGLASGVFSCGLTLSTFPETRYQLEKSIEGFNPTDFFNYYELLEKQHQTTDLKTIASSLCLSHWDPFLFNIVIERINTLFAKEDTEIIDYIVDNIAKIVDNFYFIPGCDDIFFSVGLLFYTLDHYDKSIHFYTLSQRYFESGFEVFYNLALSHYYNEDYQEATEYLSRALSYQPNDKEIKRLLRSSKLKLKKIQDR